MHIVHLAGFYPEKQHAIAKNLDEFVSYFDRLGDRKTTLVLGHGTVRPTTYLRRIEDKHHLIRYNYPNRDLKLSDRPFFAKIYPSRMCTIIAVTTDKRAAKRTANFFLNKDRTVDKAVLDI